MVNMFIPAFNTSSLIHSTAALMFIYRGLHLRHVASYIMHKNMFNTMYSTYDDGLYLKKCLVTIWCAIFRGLTVRSIASLAMNFR